MLKLTQLSHHALTLLGELAERECRFSARDLAGRLNLPVTTTAKILKSLTRGGILISHRGTQGGYGLAKAPNQISVAEIVAALEGPLCQTTRKPHRAGEMVNQAIVRALEQISLYEMAAEMGRQIPASESEDQVDMESSLEEKE
ncbi:MAG: Rrf2 family transcriptional regulator [Myxococcota bacterium]|nr:Rrf2 family transcriptional regulator [Myxococcota bacterium]